MLPSTEKRIQHQTKNTRRWSNSTVTHNHVANVEMFSEAPSSKAPYDISAVLEDDGNQQTFQVVPRFLCTQTAIDLFTLYSLTKSRSLVSASFTHVFTFTRKLHPEQK